MSIVKPLRIAALLAALAVVGAVVAAQATARTHAQTLTIWADAEPHPGHAEGGRSLGQPARHHDQRRPEGVRHHPVNDLGTVDASTAPDVVIGASDWVGGFSANGLVVPLVLSKTVKSQFPSYSLDAMSYGTAVKRL